MQQNALKFIRVMFCRDTRRRAPLMTREIGARAQHCHKSTSCFCICHLCGGGALLGGILGGSRSMLREVLSLLFYRRFLLSSFSCNCIWHYLYYGYFDCICYIRFLVFCLLVVSTCQVILLEKLLLVLVSQGCYFHKQRIDECIFLPCLPPLNVFETTMAW